MDSSRRGALGWILQEILKSVGLSARISVGLSARRSDGLGSMSYVWILGELCTLWVSDGLFLGRFLVDQTRYIKR